MAETHSIHIKVDSSDANTAARNLNNMERATNGAEAALSKLVKAAAGLVAFETLRRASAYVIEQADAYSNMSSKLRLATSSADEYAAAQEQLFKVAQDNKTALTDTIDLYSRLSIGLKEMGQSQSQIITMTDNVSKALRISGASTAEASSVITQFGQAMGSGVLRGEEFNAVMENGPRLARALADGLGVPIGALRKMAEQGQLTSDIVVKAIQSQTDALNREAATMNTTVSQAWQTLENAVTQYIGKVDQANGTSKELAQSLEGLAKNFDNIAHYVEVAIGEIGLLADDLSALKSVIDTINEGWALMFNGIAKMAAGTRYRSPALKEEASIKADRSFNQAITKEEWEERRKLADQTKKDAEAAEKSIVKLSNSAVSHTRKVSRAASKSADDSRAAFEAVIEANVRQAENAASIYEAQARTSKKRLENELEAAQEAARLDMKQAQNQEEKLKIAEDLQKKQEEIIVKETELRNNQVKQEEILLATRIAAIQQEIMAADQFNLKQSERIRLQTELQALQAQQEVLPEQYKQIELDTIRELTAATAEYNEMRVGGEESVREEALRTLEVLSSNLEYSREMMRGLSDAFGGLGEAIGGVTVAIAEYAKQQATIRIEADEAIRKNPAKRYEIEQAAAEKSAKTQIKAYGDMASSAQKFFKEGTAGYNAMGAAVKVFRAFEMAQAVMSAVKQIEQMGGLLDYFTQSLVEMGVISAAQTTKEVTESATKASAKAAEGAANQGTSGDPYSAFARVAAWVALMAGLGIAISGGGASAAPAPTVAGTGTVMGDPEAQSQSIGNSLKMLVELNSNDLAYSAGMLQALKNIENALADASTLVARDVMPLLSQVMSQFNSSGMISSSKVTEAGFILLSKELKKILKSGSLEGLMGYRAESSFGLMGEWKSADQVLVSYGSSIASAFGKIVKNVYNTIVEAGKGIGVSADELARRANGYKVAIGKINIAGMNSEEAAKAIEAAFSSMSDKMAKKLLPEFKAFQRSGEGYFETMVRVGAGIADATGKLELLGFQAIDYKDIIEKSGDVSAEIAKQTLSTQTDLSDGAKEYIMQLTGSIDDIIDAYKKLENISNLMQATGVNADNLNRDLINAAGGLEKFGESLQIYFENFFSQEEQLAAQWALMEKEFAKFGYTMPKTREDFRKMVDSWKVHPEDQARIIGLAGGFNQLMDMIDSMAESVNDLTDSVISFQRSVAGNIAELMGAGAVAELAAADLSKAWADVDNYIGSLTADTERNVEKEMELLSSLQSAVMARYNAEMAKLREAAQAQAEMMRASLQEQVDSINKAAQAQVDGINAALDAQVTAIQAAADAEIESINARLDAETEARQKANEAALDALQLELDSANKLKSALQQVRDFAKGLALGGSSPLSPEARLREAQRQYQDLLSRAQGGDADAISQLSGSSQAYLDAARQYFGSGTQYANIFDGVKQAMEQIGGMSAPDPDSIQSRIDLLRQSQTDELQALREAAQGQIKEIQTRSKDQIDSARQNAKDQITAIQDAAKEQIKALQDEVNQAIKDLTDPDKNEAMKALKDETIAELQRIYELSDKVREEAERQAEKARQIIEEQRDYMKNQADFMERVADAIAPTNGTSKQEELLADALTEQKALVATQAASNPKIIKNLANVSDRLEAIERTLRIR